MTIILIVHFSAQYVFIPILMSMNLLLMVIDEMTGRSAMFVHVFGMSLILSKVAHFVAITKSHKGSTIRVLGVSVNFSILLVLSFLLIIKGL